MTDPGYRINTEELLAYNSGCDITREAALRAMEGFEQKVEAAVNAAWADGKDFVRSRDLTTKRPNIPDEYDFTAPYTITISCLGGAVERGSVENSSMWVVFPCPDDPALRTVRAYADSLKP